MPMDGPYCAMMWLEKSEVAWPFCVKVMQYVVVFLSCAYIP